MHSATAIQSKPLDITVSNLRERPFPKEEIRAVLEFLGFEMVEGRLDVETFDQIVNGLIKACHGDFQCELAEIKRGWKFILDL